MGLSCSWRGVLIGANGFIACQRCHGQRTVHQISEAVSAMQTLFARANEQSNAPGRKAVVEQCSLAKDRQHEPVSVSFDSQKR